jgi:hypothetical protein
MSRPDKIKPVLRILLTSLICFLIIPLMAQEVVTLKQGRNSLGAQDIKYKKLVISITPVLNYRVDENNHEVIVIHFKAEWTGGLKDEWIFIINDIANFSEFVKKAKPNWTVNKKIKDDIRKKTLEFIPANIFEYTAVRTPQYFADSSYKITVDVQNYQNETVTMNVIFYLGSSDGPKGFEVDQIANALTWNFKLPHRASKDCKEKYDDYQSQLNDLKPERNKNRFDEYKLKEEKTDGELSLIHDNNIKLNNLLASINDDITSLNCSNLKSLNTEYKQYVIEESEFKDIKSSLNEKQAAVEQEKADITGKLSTLYDNRASIKIHYRELKQMQWDTRATKTFDIVLINNRAKNLDDLNKIEGSSYGKLLESGKLSPEMRLLKNDFDSYYEASIQIIEDFKSQEKENQNVTQSNKSASNVKKAGKRWTSVIWYVLPLFAFLSGMAIFKYWGKIKKVLSLKHKIKS